MALILPRGYHKIAAVERNHISWIDALINSIMSIFSWSDNEPSTAQSMITEPIVEEYVPEQEYQWDNPIIIDLEF